jgi:dihydroorotate dehydrogenase (NAD+) catalytic subunit
MDLSVSIAGLELRNPVMTASGTFGYGEEYAEFMDLDRLGAVVVKGLSVKPKEGNPPPRIVETASGMLNSIGLQNIGIERFIKEKMPFLRTYDTKVIVNFFGDSVDEYVEAAEKLSSVDGVHALEMNISCPNKQAGWAVFGTDPSVTFNVVSSVRKSTSLPLIVKLSPNVTDISVIARSAVDAGADALSAINTLTGMAIDINTQRPILANKVGGLSGPAIKPVAVKMVYELFRSVKVPVIGMGGIMSGDDAVEFMLSGASAVAVGTANFINPSATIEIIDGIASYLLGRNIGRVSDIIGAAHAA